MINFRTEIKISPQKLRLDYQTYILLAGSCFSENIGNLLISNKFRAVSNPFGTIFNPISLFENLKIFFGQKQVKDNLFLEHQSFYFHYDFHSQFFANSPENFYEKIAQQISAHQNFIDNLFSEKSCLILTFGTAWVYELKQNNHIVSNCHKQNSQLLEKNLLSVEQIVEAFEDFYENLPLKISIVLTLSPVRHLKDTLSLNTVSKATLRLAIHQIIEKYPEIIYFQSYELFLDDLRDYRFCEQDLLHPNSVAIAYIFEKFQDAFFEEKTVQILQKWQKLQKSLAHKLFLKNSLSEKKFLEKLLSDLEQFKEIDIQTEIEELKNRIENYKIF